MNLVSRAKGAITIYDLTDSRQLVAYIASSNRRQVIYDPNTGEYKPNYATKNNILTPEIYLAGSTANQIQNVKDLKWSVQIDSMGAFQEIEEDENYSFGEKHSLVIKGNILKDHISMVYKVDILYHDTQIDKDIFVQADIELVKLENGKVGESVKTTIAVLTNDSHIVPTDYKGNNGNFSFATTAIQIFTGAEDTTTAWTISAKPSSGVTGKLVGSTYTVAGMTVDSGYVDIIANKGEEEIIKRFTVSKAKSGYTPVKGVDYFDGGKGDSAYIWVRYSQNADGSGMTSNPTGAKYLGTTTTNTTPAPSDYKAYQWVKVEGKDGIPGKDGSQLHIKYSNDGGKTFTANNGEAFGDYIGKLVDFTVTDSTVPSDYTWGKITGDDATAYYLILGPKVIKKTSSGALDANSVTITAKSQTGSEAVTNYNGRFTIEEDVGSGLSLKYTSSVNETSKTYPITTATRSVRVRLYQAGGTNTLLDEEMLTVVSDGAVGDKGTDAVLLTILNPDGDTIRNHTGNLRATAELLEGIKVVKATSYQWYERDPKGAGDADSGAGWNKLTVGYTGGTTGFTTDTLTVTPSAIKSSATFMVIAVYKGIKLKRETTVNDITDAYTFATIGNGTFKNSQGVNTYTQKVYHNGEEVDKAGNTFRYQWNMYNADGTLDPKFSKVGKSITLSAGEHSGKGLLYCLVSE